MHDADRRIDALVYSLGWVLLMVWVWGMAAWVIYLGWVAGCFPFVPDQWWPPRELYWVFIGAVKLMIGGLGAAWIAVLLYRRRLRHA